jgi:hypothetical protein
MAEVLAGLGMKMVAPGASKKAMQASNAAKKELKREEREHEKTRKAEVRQKKRKLMKQQETQHNKRRNQDLKMQAVQVQATQVWLQMQGQMQVLPQLLPVHI